MAIDRLLRDAVFPPDAVSAMVAGFEATLRELKLTDRDDPITELIARLIIDCAKDGERDPIKLRDCAMEGLGA
ncbi:MAG: hypothetical protein ACJ8E1_04665 [Xanthobacteraceae bacterium]